MRATIAFLLLVLIIVVLAACKPDADTQLGVRVPLADSPRLKITRVGVVEDDLAYARRRGLYIIQDTLTGKSYVGVSGIGITEVGSHTAGKTTQEDER